MLNRRYLLFILSFGIFDISDLVREFSGFENENSCLAIYQNTSVTSVAVKNAYDFPVVTWVLKNQKWEKTIGTTFKEKLFANSTAEKLQFCFLNTSREDSGHYSWKDIRGNTQTITFKVWYGPKDLITIPKVENILTLDKYQHFTIVCSAECNPECMISWTKDKDAIKNSTSSCPLILNNVSINDNGNYTCLAENPKNRNCSMSKRFRISVQLKINQTFQEENEVKENSNINISCRFDGFPLSNISWLKEKKEINTTYSVENEVVLYFKNTSCDDTGVYQCSAFNGLGQTHTKESMLNVLCKPRFINNYFGYTRVTASIGEEIKINASIQANPAPQVVCNDSEIQTKIDETSNTTCEVFVQKLVLSEYDFRKHTLIIGNSQGNVTIVIEVEKKRRNSVIFYGYVIAVPFIVLILITILVLILLVIKRRKHHNDNQANSNPENNNDTGGYRDNILYQSIDSVPLEARDNFNVSDSDSFEESISNVFFMIHFFSLLYLLVLNFYMNNFKFLDSNETDFHIKIAEISPNYKYNLVLM